MQREKPKVSLASKTFTPLPVRKTHFWCRISKEDLKNLVVQTPAEHETLLECVLCLQLYHPKKQLQSAAALCKNCMRTFTDKTSLKLDQTELVPYHKQQLHLVGFQDPSFDALSQAFVQL